MRQNPHVRICGGPGSATTLVYPTKKRHNHRMQLTATPPRDISVVPAADSKR